MLINTHDNYTLAPEFTEGMEKSNFLVIILTKSDGNSLVEFLEKFYQDVLARLDVVNSVDVAPALSQQQPSEIQQQKDTTVVTKDRRSGSEATGTLYMCMYNNISDVKKPRKFLGLFISKSVRDAHLLLLWAWLA